MHNTTLRRLPAVLFALAAPMLFPENGSAQGTIQVAAPTGTTSVDRANVQAAFDSVRPGDTVLLAAGTYLLGGGATLRVPDVTVLGHTSGTVLRGCDPEALDIDESEMLSVVFGCTGFFVQAERSTIRDLTFEHMWHGIVVGPFPVDAEEAAASQGLMPPAPASGQRIEGNTFRASANGLRILGVGDEPSIVRDNDFIDVFHAIGMYGHPVHFTANRISVEEPELVPLSRHPASAIIASPQHSDCSGHVIADNDVDGHPGAVYVLAGRGETCRGVEIRNNTIRVGRVRVPETWGGADPTPGDSTMVGVPVTLSAMPWITPDTNDDTPEGVVEDVLVSGNRILGAEGIGILVDGPRNRILGNAISDIRVRAPFPGINWAPSLVRWGSANGSAIWVGPLGRQVEIAGNTFTRIAGPEVSNGGR